MVLYSTSHSRSVSFLLLERLLAERGFISEKRTNLGGFLVQKSVLLPWDINRRNSWIISKGSLLPHMQPPSACVQLPPSRRKYLLATLIRNRLV